MILVINTNASESNFVSIVVKLTDPLFEFFIIQ